MSPTYRSRVAFQGISFAWFKQEHNFLICCTEPGLRTMKMTSASLEGRQDVKDLTSGSYRASDEYDSVERMQEESSGVLPVFVEPALPGAAGKGLGDRPCVFDP